MTRRPRLDPSVFHLPVEKMRAGYYSDNTSCGRARSCSPIITGRT